MTLLNTILCGDRAFVVADTLQYHDDASLVLDERSRPRETTKIVALTHASCALAVRGSCAIGPFVLANAGRAASFDEWLVEMPHLLRSAASALGLRDHARTATNPGNEVRLVGWSESRAAFALAQWESTDGFETSGRRLMSHAGASDSTGLYAPGVPSDWRPSGPMTSAQTLIDMAVEQVQFERERDKSAPYGGSIIVAEIQRDSLMLRRAASVGYPEFAAHATAREEGALTQIAVGATKEVLLDQTPFFAASNASSSDVTTIGQSATFQNLSGAPVTVQVDWSCLQVYSYAYNLMTAHRIWIEQSGAIGGATSDTITDLPTTGDAPHGVAKFFQYSLANGATVNLQVKVRSAGPSACAINIDAALLRVTVLKR